eukprot:11225176-Lingulodinium_polyedra.AAC.3
MCRHASIRSFLQDPSVLSILFHIDRHLVLCSQAFKQTHPEAYAEKTQSDTAPMSEEAWVFIAQASHAAQAHARVHAYVHTSMHTSMHEIR